MKEMKTVEMEENEIHRRRPRRRVATIIDYFSVLVRKA